MIAFLTGQAKIYQNFIILLTSGGVGSKVYLGIKTLRNINSKQQQEIHLYTYTHVKEDKLELFGFLDEREIKIFEMVLSVSGVGPKTALNLVDAGIDNLITAVQNAQLRFFTKIPRVGKKLAQKIIIELKSKVGSLKELDLTPKSSQQLELIQALQALEFDESAIEDIVNQIDLEKLTIQQAIKQAIKLINQ